MDEFGDSWKRATTAFLDCLHDGRLIIAKDARVNDSIAVPHGVRHNETIMSDFATGSDSFQVSDKRFFVGIGRHSAKALVDECPFLVHFGVFKVAHCL